MARDSFEDRDEDVLAARAAAGDALGNALVYVTTLILLGAFLLMEKGLADKYNGGMFKDPARDSAPVTPPAS
jgi:hypothetical protein